jgi:hypothetical protein
VEEIKSKHKSELEKECKKHKSELRSQKHVVEKINLELVVERNRRIVEAKKIKL